KSILIYMESIGDARAFMSAARQAALSKPIIVIKAGRTEAAARAAASHTGSLTGSDEVLDAAFRRCGVMRVQRIADLFHMLELLAKDPGNDGLMVILTPQAMTDPTRTAEQLQPVAQKIDKPVLTSWMGGKDIAPGAAALVRAGIPNFDYPESATQAFNYMWR